MLIANTHPDHRKPLDPVEVALLGVAAGTEVERFLTHRDNHAPTPLYVLRALASEVDVAAIHVKDESLRLGLGSFKALGGSYAVIRLVLEEASRCLGRVVDIGELHDRDIRAVAQGMTFGCATDGNHGRSVAAGAELVGARAAIFVHSGVSDERVAAIARLGARMIRVAGTYDDSVAEAARACAEKGWQLVCDTSWPGYERIPGLIMQGYTVIVAEALRDLPQPPTHVFLQAGVGGFAAAIAGHMTIALGERRPLFVVVEPERAACLHESARAGQPVTIEHGEPTVMAMLECYKPSLVAWRVLTRVADAWMTVSEDDALAAMNCLARPKRDDPALVAGESGGAGLAGLLRVVDDRQARKTIGLDGQARVLIISTEGATDPSRYAELVGLAPADVVVHPTSAV